MAITKQDVEYVAMLARLEFTEDEKEKFTVQLDRILGYVGKLNEINADDIKPTSHVLPLQNVFRADEAKVMSSREAGLANAPDHTEEFFKVPQIMEG